MNLDQAFAEKLRKHKGITFFPRIKGNVKATGIDVTFECFTQHPPGHFMPLGSYSYSQSAFTHVSKIGRYCSIGSGVEIMGAAHPTDRASSSPAFYRPRRSRIWGSARKVFHPFEDFGPPIEMGNDVWIGDNVLLAHGVKIGTGAIIAARSVVTRNVPAYAIVGGTPAQLIRWRFDEQIIERLLGTSWWRWPLETWDTTDTTDIQEFLEAADEVKLTVAPMAENRFSVRELLIQME